MMLDWTFGVRDSSGGSASSPAYGMAPSPSTPLSPVYVMVSNLSTADRHRSSVLSSVRRYMGAGGLACLLEITGDFDRLVF